jgi:hypothetical protein
VPKVQNRGNARDLKAAVICSFVILVLLGALTNVGASAGAMQMAVQGFGTVHGQLENATIEPNGTVSMLMLVNDQMQTSQGNYPVSANGLWVGVRNGSALTGKIQGVAGKVQICVLVCQDANFVGEGHWSGLLDGSNAVGNFSGTITFTNSPVQQIPVGQPIPAYGTWTSDFQSPIPEFASEIGTYTLVFMIVAFTLVILRSRQRNRSQNGLRQSQANLGRKFP